MRLSKSKHKDGLKKSTQLRFGGYNALGTEGELCDMENMTSDYYPELASRPERKNAFTVTRPRGFGAGDELYWLAGGDLHYGELEIENAVTETDEMRTFAQIGDTLTVWPDKIGVDVTDGSIRKLNAVKGDPVRLYWLFYTSFAGTYSTKRNRLGINNIGVSMVSLPDFRVGDALTISGNIVYPENNVTAVLREFWRNDYDWWGLVFDDYTFTPVNIVRVGLTEALSGGTYYFDAGCTDYALRLISVPAVESGSVFVRFKEGTIDDYKYEDIEKVVVVPTGATEYTQVDYTSAEVGLETAPSGTTMLPFDSLHRTYDYDYLPPPPWSHYAWTEYLKIERAVPDLDIVFAHENRLYGAKGDTIYVSKWGDPFNWNAFEGTATDSFTTETGTPGSFTGGISYGGYPRFFKEDYIFTLYGDYPAEYELVEHRQLGVMEGSGASLAVGDGRLFYLSPQGPCVYSGGEPARIAEAFGTTKYKNGVGASDDVKYYLAMQDENGAYHQFVYDIQRNIWMREDDANALAMCRYSGEVWRLDADGSVQILGRPMRYPADAEDEGDVEWYAEFGDIACAVPERKRVTKLMLRLELQEDAAIRVRMKFDSEDTWRTVATAAAPSKRSVLLPVIPRRHDHFRLRIEGTGQCRISSLSIEAETGSVLH